MSKIEQLFENLISVGITDEMYGYKKQEEVNSMAKSYDKFMSAGSYFNTLEEAKDAAARYASKYQQDSVVWQAVEKAKVPAPKDIEFEKLV